MPNDRFAADAARWRMFPVQFATRAAQPGSKDTHDRRQIHRSNVLFRRYRGIRGADRHARRIGGEILCTRQIADALAQAEHTDIEVAHRHALSLKNLPAPVELYEIVLSGVLRQYAIDPVCKMQVDTRRDAGDLHFNQKTYWLCLLACVERFAKQPDAYIQGS